MIEICFKHDNMHIFGIINAFNCINNHVINVKIACYQRSMSIEQSMELKGAYNVMKVKLLKYESQVKRKPMFPIATMFDPSLKLEYIPMDEQAYIMQHMKNLLRLMPAPPTSSTCTQGET